jgi:hypothetical protein
VAEHARETAEAARHELGLLQQVVLEQHELLQEMQRSLRELEGR